MECTSSRSGEEIFQIVREIIYVCWLVYLLARIRLLTEKIKVILKYNSDIDTVLDKYL